MPPVTKKIKKPIEKVKEKIVSEDEEIKVENVVSAQLQKKLDKKAKKHGKRPERGVILVRHLPHGFFEDQLKQYFEQFGLVTRLRLARSRSTGNTKGFAFIEFATPEVAKIAAETMDNYLMFKKIVQTHYIPPEEQKYNYFKSRVKKVTTPLGKDIYISGKTKLTRYKIKQNNIWNQYNYAKRTTNNIKKLDKLKKKYADLGLNFDDITIAPKLVPFEDIEKKKNVNNDDDDDKEKTTNNLDDEQSDDNNEVGSLLLIKKRKRNSNQKENLKIPKLTTTTTNKNNVKQLLDKTFEDESEDEDYIPDSSEEISKIKITSKNKNNLKQLLDKTLEDESSSEDEDYIPDNLEEQNLKQNFLKELNEITEEDESEDDESSKDDSKITGTTDEEDTEDNNSPVKKSFAKSTKPQKTVDHFEKIIRRTSHLGGIQKNKNKIIKSKSSNKKSAVINKNKEKLINSAAKEMIKSNKIHKLKKIDLKKKK